MRKSICWVAALLEWHDKISAEVRAAYGRDVFALEEMLQRHHRMFQEMPEFIHKEALRRYGEYDKHYGHVDPRHSEYTFTVKITRSVVLRVDRRLDEPIAGQAKKDKVFVIGNAVRAADQC